jgi:carboxymethylenebutenolidase
VTRRIAAEGYVALAPDMFWRGGKGRTAGYDQLPQALTLMGELTDDGIVSDVRNAIDALERRPDVRAGRIGITGFCMGGRVSYLAACALPDRLRASAPFYGGGIPIDRTATLKAPVLAFFGDQDPFIPLDQVEALRREAARLDKRLEVVVYPGAPHGFFCNERDSYRPDAAADAWTRVKAFFAQQLAA